MYIYIYVLKNLNELTKFGISLQSNEHINIKVSWKAIR